MFQITTKNDAPKAWFEIFLRSDTRTCPQRLVINLMQKIFPKIPNNNINNKNRNNNNHLWILEMGWLLKFISFRSISFQLGGRLRRPLNWNEHLLRTYNFEILTITPFSKSRFCEGKDFLVQTAAQKWSSLQKMILSTRWSFWQEMSRFYFSPWKRSKGGTIGGFFLQSNPAILLVFHLFLPCFPLNMIIPPRQINIYVLQHESGSIQVLRQHISPNLVTALARPVFELQKCYLDENWSEFNQEFFGVLGTGLACLVQKLRQILFTSLE